MKLGTVAHEQWLVKQEQEDRRKVKESPSVILLAHPHDVHALGEHTYVAWGRRSWQFEWSPIAYCTTFSTLHLWCRKELATWEWTLVFRGQRDSIVNHIQRGNYEFKISSNGDG
jgi:hypothetical protein